MELETLFTEQKWNILKLLSKNELSPLQMAEESNTTIANISQQLRLLEAAELVDKHKIRNRDKGKPRTLFTLSQDHAYVIAAMNGFAEKKLLELDDFRKILLKAWFLEKYQADEVENILYKIKDNLNKVRFIAIEQDELYIVGDIKISSKKLKIKLISEQQAKNLTKGHKQVCVLLDRE